jgi:hypothetical protein
MVRDVDSLQALPDEKIKEQSMEYLVGFSQICWVSSSHRTYEVTNHVTYVAFVTNGFLPRAEPA